MNFLLSKSRFKNFHQIIKEKNQKKYFYDLWPISDLRICGNDQSFFAPHQRSPLIHIYRTSKSQSQDAQGGTETGQIHQPNVWNFLGFIFASWLKIWQLNILTYHPEQVKSNKKLGNGF